MKKVILAILTAICFQYSKAQTFNEWFKQGKTQNKYLIEQISALKTYSGYVQRGYSIAKKGLTTIAKIKEGDFDLQDDFFASLKNVNPVISNYSKVANIISYHLKILQTYKQICKQVKSLSLFSPSETDFIYNVFTNIILGSNDDIGQLITVIASKELEMKDDQRFEKIDAIYNSIQDKYAFAKNFGAEAEVLALQRIKEKNNIGISRSLYAIEN